MNLGVGIARASNGSDVHLHVYDLAGQEVKDLILFGDWFKKNKTNRLKYQEF
ncbi:hypothetical protein F5ESL0236_02630 [Lactobacillus sp. ESL0236]|uniref:GrpB family protein n=1 Tax=unclassified Lactobacillus TaxID=2620435 RepID=UPI000EFAA46D|nr:MULTISPECIES: GrpB family protein [unclassified Lactobacillus]RMC40823.1 hypothetical protein F5ESL0237_02630 [Lactobacillus sp. ESL0237]RMC44578.1 hypothetical protein F5ESL0234_02625 [Lactobacillus sp. ESL0234]RMC45885.1 hypothetical protein F5ESL0236_02630 [Lactobacillus sp. ESL0236]